MSDDDDIRPTFGDTIEELLDHAAVGAITEDATESLGDLAGYAKLHRARAAYWKGRYEGLSEGTAEGLRALEETVVRLARVIETMAGEGGAS